MYVHIGHRFKRRENQILIQRMRVNALVLQLTTKMKICFIAYYYYTRGKKTASDWPTRFFFGLAAAVTDL